MATKDVGQGLRRPEHGQADALGVGGDGAEELVVDPAAPNAERPGLFERTWNAVKIWFTRGELPLYVGLYDPVAFRRLPVLPAGGPPDPDSRLRLTTLEFK